MMTMATVAVATAKHRKATHVAVSSDRWTCVVVALITVEWFLFVVLVAVSSDGWIEVVVGFINGVVRV